ncbi:MAG: hypothetical protein Q8P41_12655 [Pseudomonadota bacterium]|nr:hypothetical protein [Pseudomonadota bacterium]
MTLLVLLACTTAQDAPPEFSDAARYGLEHFDDPEEDALAAPLLALEAEIDGTLDMSSDVSADRSLALEVLTGEEIDGLTHPDRDPSAAIPPVALARDSAFPVASHVEVAMRADLSPMEPNSPDLYERALTDGGDCWAAHECVFLRTVNNVNKTNFLMDVTYVLNKDYRWVDLGDGRLALAARSWMPESGFGLDGGTTIWQSYTFEIFVPREGDTTLRMMAVWSESEFSVQPSEETVASVQLVGIDDIFKAHDEWLTENPG